MSRSLLHPSIFIALFGMGCIETWKGTDGDGDGVSLADGDCWDAVDGPPGSGLTGADIYPGAPDTPYDGFDADCGGNDDFDLDGDGYVISDEHLGKATLGVADSGANHIGIGDCWDDPDLAPDSPDHIDGKNFTNVINTQVTAAEVHPDQTDTWYDGPDQDCGGNDDFDQDGDGQRSDKATDQDGIEGDDCVDMHPDDDINANLAGLAPEEIFLGADELWYDGTDQDCSGVYNPGLEVDEVLSDCDYDADGAPVADGPDVPDGSACRDYTGISRDCNDEDSGAKPDPTVPEIFYNGVDDNCTPVLDGEPDTDGDADRDGHWSADYPTLVTEVDGSVDLEGVVFDDCWDDPDTTPAAYVGEDVRTFDPQGDPDDPDSFTVLFAAGSLTAADVKPTALDRPYDGVDQDCAGDDSISDEYDWDGDGEQSMYQWYTDPDTTAVVAGADCMDCSADCASAEGDLLVLCEALCDNDAYVDLGTGGLINPGGFESSEVNPDASDTLYDGTDQDCARNIDFDDDGDYYATDPTAAIAQGEAREAYYFWDTIGFLYASDADCNDSDATINPGLESEEIWYDGEDTDCDGEDDYDQDYDGYIDNDYEGLKTYAAAPDAPDRESYVYPSTGELPLNDCNDDPLDDGASYNEGQTDTWYDGTDNDCGYNDDYDADLDGVASEAQASSYGDTMHGSTVGVEGELDTDDCDDTDIAINPSAAEFWYDGVDRNCDEKDDYDADEDGHADASTTAYGPTTNESGDIPGTGTLPVDDCNDTEAVIYTGATDVWYDGIDHDCDERDDYDADEDNDAWDGTAYGTTYQSTGTSSTYAVSGTGSLTATDCNEEEAGVNGNATDTWRDGVDQDCGGNDDYDIDGDGYVLDADVGLVTYQSQISDTDYVLSSTGSLPGDDCVEGNAAYNPLATDVWYDGNDHDCADNDDWDMDEDGHAAEGTTVSYTDTTHDGTVVAGTGGLPVDDCNDEEDVIYTGATDVWYDGIDHDCDEADDFDADDDGHASQDESYAATYQSTSEDPTYIVSTTGSLDDDDCNDNDDEVFGGSTTTDTWYDGIDSNCDGLDDYDADEDGYIPDAYVGLTTYQSADLDLAYTVPGTGGLPGDDCVDDNDAYNPGATDVWYDGEDHDCADNDDWDQDEDGYAAAGTTVAYTTTTHDGTAVPGTGGLADDDCNDEDDAVNTGASDTWYDGIDHDCDEADDYDQDADGFASLVESASYGTTYQSTTLDAAYAVSGSGALSPTDCNDEEAVILPSATDTWRDGIDSDCDGADDYDIDADGYVLDSDVGLVTYQSAVSDADYLLSSTGSLPGDDCVENNAAYNPDATDTWYDGLDHDCADNDDWDRDVDGHAAEGTTVTYTTTTHDGAAVSGTGGLSVDDCNDEDAAVYTGAADAWYDGIDHDCDEADDFDQDADGYASLNESGSYGTTYQSTTFAAAYAVSGSGALSATDCNDEESVILPSATDIWRDGIDADCDGADDYDIDGDGYVLDADVGLVTYQSAVSDTDYLLGTTGSLPGDDCVEDDAAYNPAATDTWYDGLDHDCADNDDWDADVDGHAAEGTTVSYTTTTHDGAAVSGTGSLLVDDCNDTDAVVYTGATDTWYDGIDHDCDEADDFDQDLDGDAYDGATYTATYQDSGKDPTYVVAGTGALSTDADCNDTDAAVLSTATETWYDGVDTDCGGEDDFDADEDGYASLIQAGSYATTYQSSTSQPAYALGTTGSLSTDDCDDSTSTVNPGQPETWYDGADQNCDDADDWDADGDGHANEDYTATYTTTTNESGAIAGTGLLTVDDCNDTEDDVSPSETDSQYDGTDADCDGADDYDQDGDGYVPDAFSGLVTYQSFDDMVSTTYELSSTGSLPDGDCLDQDVGAFTATDYNPGVTETWYDGQDQDCGSDDDYDQDGDGYVRDADLGEHTDVALTRIVTATGTNGGDCNDVESAFNPGASDAFYDGLDHNCDDADDYDQDLDGYVASANSGLMTYTDAAKTTAVAGTGTGLTDDCDDTNPGANSGQTEVCDASDVDEDCNGVADDSDSGVDSGTQTTYYTDADADSYGLDGSGTLLCNAPAASSLVDGDCDDTNAAINSGATEIAGDSVDQDCDTEELCYADADNDGYTDLSTVTSSDIDCSGTGEGDSAMALLDADCDETDANINPGETEVCDGLNVDEDCSGAADDDDSGVDPSGFTDWYTDGDSDLYGDENATAVTQCDAPAGSVSDNTDCNDADADINPGESEALDGKDNDCDDDYDEGLITTDSEYVLITEIMIDPDNVSDIFGEWFEIYNPNAFDITLDEDWVFFRSAGTGFNPSSTPFTLAAGDYAVFVRNSSTGINGNVTPDFTYGGAGIAGFTNSGDYLVAAYFDPDDAGTDTNDLATAVVVDEVDWDSASWTLTIPTGATLQLDNDGGYPSGVVSDDDTAWCDATTAWDTGDFGSPGTGNEACP